MQLEKALKEEKKGLFHTEGNYTFFSKLTKLMRGGYKKKRDKPELWKRIVMKIALFFANVSVKLFGADIGVTVDDITTDEVLYQKELEDKIIEAELISAAKILQDQENRKRRGRIIRPKKKIIHRKKGIADYGKFIGKDGKEITPFLKP